MAGLTVFVLNRGTIVESCYAVVSFNGTGVSFGSCADISSYSSGTLRYCAYQTYGSQTSKQGTQISVDCFNGADGYYAFRNAMNTLTVWNLDGSTYPTLEGVNVRFPNSSVPNFN